MHENSPQFLVCFFVVFFSLVFSDHYLSNLYCTKKSINKNLMNFQVLILRNIAFPLKKNPKAVCIVVYI